MEIFILLLLPILFTGKQKSKPAKRKVKKDSMAKYRDKGDCWKCTYKEITDLNPTVQPFFTSLWNHINFIGLKHDIDFAIFETRRHIDRQSRLVKKGVSWVADVSKAPHVEGRAFDIVVRENGVYKWDEKKLKLLRDEVEKSFRYANLLRKRINKDLPHYELKRGQLKVIGA